MIIDLVIILVIVLFTFIGYKQGLVKTAIKILSFFIALIVSLMLYKTVGNIIIKNTNIDENIENAITSKVLNENYEEKLNMLPESLISSGENTINGMAEAITEKIIYIVVFIALFIILRIALIFVRLLADLITKIPIIKQFDKAGGLIYGLAKGALIVTVVFAVISIASPMIGEDYIKTINNSTLGSNLYNHNLILGLIK